MAFAVKTMNPFSRSKLATAFALASAALLAWVAPAGAAPLPVDGFALTISEDISNMGGLSKPLMNAMTLVAQDQPMVTINNTSTASSIEQIYLQMGNSAFNFGSLIMEPNASSAKAATF